MTTDPAERERDKDLTFVVIGAGRTGVEVVGQIAELAHGVVPGDYHEIDTRKARIVLIEAAPAVLGPFDEKLQRYTQTRLERMGVEVRCGTTAIAMDADSHTVRDSVGEERIPARTKVWAAGVKASPLAGCSPAPRALTRNGRGESRWHPTARCPAIRRCSRSVTWCRSMDSRVSRSPRFRRASTSGR